MKILKKSFVFVAAAVIFLTLAEAMTIIAQSGATRPRRVAPTDAASSSSSQTELTSSTNYSAGNSAPATSAINQSSGARDTARAFALLQQGQFAEAAREARQIADADPSNGEAWKIAGFAEMNLRQYEAAATSLDRALTLQRAAGREDPNTNDALAQTLMQTENYERALPLLIAATTRAGAPSDARMFYLRGLAEYRTGKPQDAETSLSNSVRLNSRNATAHFLLGQIRFERDELDAAIIALNRATVADSQLAEAWTLLAYAYLRRAASVEGAEATTPSRAEADGLNAVRAGERLYRLRPDARSAILYGQALIAARQFTRAVTVLTRASQGAQTPESATALYLLGVAHSRARAYPRAITALEAAAARTPNDANIQRELGYAYEVTRQSARALAAYQRGAEIAPDDAGFRESIERVRPLVR